MSSLIFVRHQNIPIKLSIIQYLKSIMVEWGQMIFFLKLGQIYLLNVLRPPFWTHSWLNQVYEEEVEVGRAYIFPFRGRGLKGQGTKLNINDHPNTAGGRSFKEEDRYIQFNAYIWNENLQSFF